MRAATTRIGTVILALVTAACGGGESPPTSPDRTGVEDKVLTAVSEKIAAPSQATWSAVRTLPLVPVSMANLPGGKVLFWSAEQKFSFDVSTTLGRTYFATFDPATNAVTERTVTETGHDMFCPGTTNLPDGRLLVNGGLSAKKTSIFDPATGTWSTAAAMNINRGYQANTLLKDGSVLTLGGSWNVPDVGNKHGEVWTAAGGWQRRSGIPIEPFLSVDTSRNFGGDSHFMLLPAGNGKVFHAGPGVNMHWITTEGAGSVTDAGPRGDDQFSVSGTTVMYEQGKILKAGGSPGYDRFNANANSYVIDINSGVSVRKIAPMAYRRAFHNSVVLPNGQVLIVGGQTYAVGFDDANSVLVPELFDPVTETFTTMRPIAVPRNYHSLAILLPDARVVSAGGGLCGSGCVANHADLQILTPHYLLNDDGTPAVRPVITAAPTSARYGTTMTVTTNSAITSFAMVRASSTTHTVNNDQRRLKLTFRATGTNTWAVDVPTNPGWALAGDWMLFAMNADGVPSVARTVRVLLDGAVQIAAINDQTSSTGTSIALQPTATVPAGLTATYSATGLPPGLSIAPTTGLISGTPTVGGRFAVTVRASTAQAAVTTDLVWQVVNPADLVPGLTGEYFPNPSLTGTPVRRVTEGVNFDWGTASPGAGVPADNFSARWSGWLLPSVSGNHVLQTESDDGVRVWVNDVLVINNWTVHSATLNNSPSIALTAGVRTAVRMEYFDNGGGATARLRWAQPGSSTFAAIPVANLRSTSLVPNAAPTLATPPSQSGMAGTPASLAMVASDPDGDALAYSASGLPPGLVIASASGVISGTPTTSGTFSVTVGVDDGRGGSTAVQFAWTILDAAPQLLPVAAPAVTSGGTASWRADVSVVGSYTYQWDFGDGSAPSAWSASNTMTHTYANAGVYRVTVSARTSDGRIATSSFWQAVGGATGLAGRSSSPVVLEPRAGASTRLWVVNPDNDSVSVFDTATRTRVAEVAVGTQPQTLALAPNGRVWVVNKGSATVSIVSTSSLAVVQTVALARASKPHGIVIASDGAAFVAHESTGDVLRLASDGTPQASVNLGANLRHLALDAAGTRLLVSRFVTPALPGEGTAVVQTNVNGQPRGGEVMVVDASTLALQRTVVLAHSGRADSPVQGRGVPNYLGAPVIAPDGRRAWVPSKQDNILRGALRDGAPLDFQNTIRAISSRIDLSTLVEDATARVDHDNAGVASAAAFDPTGAYLFVALENSRQVAVIDAARGLELFRLEAGRAPQGLTVAADGDTLYVHNFMDRTVGAYDLTRLRQFGEANATLLASMASVATDRLTAQVLAGKRLFYDARDTRLSRDAYISCAACHNDGAHDGRTWDFTGFGEGLRNTVSLRGRAGAQGRLHWSANFDEVQDFEGQIRTLAQGSGLMSDAQFNTGTRSQPLGDRKAGVSADLDALAAYVASLSSFDLTPWRAADGSLTAAGQSGRSVFTARCATCHGGSEFTDSSSGTMHNVGTLKASSGQRLGGALTGIDTPTLRDAWATAPYLHDGSAASIQDAVRAHNVFSLTSAEVDAVADYVRQIGREEPAPSGATTFVSPIFGGAGGASFADPVAEGQWLTGVVVRTGWWVDSIQGLASPSNLTVHGGGGGIPVTVTWPANEYLVRVFGVAGTFVGQVGFVTNTGRVLGPYGSALGSGAGAAFDFTAPAGARIVGFAGRAQGYLDGLGVIYVQGTVAPPDPGVSPIFGAATGTSFTDPVVAGQALTGVVVQAGSWVDGMQGLALPSDLPHHGGLGGGRNVVTWPAGEHLVRVFGISGDYVGQVGFATNTGRVLGPYGAALGPGWGSAFDYTVPTGNRIVGFTGRTGSYLHAIGVVYAP